MLNIEEIISNAIDASVKSIAEKRIVGLTEIKDISIADKLKQNELLMTYTNNLLTAYHEELRKELAKQGIKI